MQKELYYQQSIKKFSVLKLLACLIGTLFLAYVSSFLSKILVGYAIIVPHWTPNENTVMLGWGVLALLAGLSLYLALQKECKTKTEMRLRFLYVCLWTIQAIVAFVWPITLLSYNKLIFSFIWIAVLDGIVVSLIISAFRLRAISGFVLIPYLAAILFATYFNVLLIILN